MTKLIPKRKIGYILDYDPKNPYHVHSNGEKVVIDPEQYEKHKEQPYFANIRKQVEEHQADYPSPEYTETENPEYRRVYENVKAASNQHFNERMFNGKTYREYSTPPESYMRNSATGVVTDEQGNLYRPMTQADVGKGVTPMFTTTERDYHNGRDFDMSWVRVKTPEKTIKTLKQPLPVDRTYDVNKEVQKKKNLLSLDINGNHTYLTLHPKLTSKTSNVRPTTKKTEPSVKTYGSKEFHALEDKTKQELIEFVSSVAQNFKDPNLKGLKRAVNKEGYSYPITHPEILKDSTKNYSSKSDEATKFIHSFNTINDLIDAMGLGDSELPTFKIYESSINLLNGSNNYLNDKRYKEYQNAVKNLAAERGLVKYEKELSPIEFLTDYVNSESFASKAPTQAYVNTARNKVSRGVNIKPGEKAKYSKSDNTIYMPNNKGVTEYMPEDVLIPTTIPYDIVLAHEFGHALDPLKLKNKPVHTYAGKPTKYPITAYEKAPEHYEALYENTKDINLDPHDVWNPEKYADLQTLRYILYKEGIFDARQNKPFTKEHLKKAKEKGLKKHSRTLQIFDDDTIIKMLNTIAYNNSNIEDVNLAKYGGKLNKFQTGGEIDFPKKPIIAGTTPDTMEAQNFVSNNNIDLANIPRREKIWADYAEPWVGGADLIATGLSVIPSTSLVGRPLKTLTTMASLAVDAAQTNEALKNKEYGSAAINGGEMALTLVGGKFISKGVNTALNSKAVRQAKRAINPNTAKIAIEKNLRRKGSPITTAAIQEATEQYLEQQAQKQSNRVDNIVNSNSHKNKVNDLTNKIYETVGIIPSAKDVGIGIYDYIENQE